MDKVIRDGEVAVLYSPGYGAGWYSWGTDHPEMVFDPDVVKLVEEDKRDEIPKLVEGKIGDDYFYTGGAEQLQIEWLPVGTQFEIREYDGHESIHIVGQGVYLTA